MALLKESVYVIFENLSKVRMKYRAGFLKVVCAWVVILMQSLDAAHTSKNHAAGVPCRLKELTALTTSLVKESLTSFDEANGKHLGTWSPGFPELKVHQNSSPSGSTLQCSLPFMAQGLEKVLEDQRSNLNPQDVSLHEKLGETISSVRRLVRCVKETLGGECSTKPSPPTMPRFVFERKQWSHTLLKTAGVYLSWVQTSLIKVRKTTKHTPKKTSQRYLEGIGYLL